MMRKTATVIVALAIVAMCAAPAQAQEDLQYKVVVTGDIVKGTLADHFLTITEPMRVPDAMLTPGTYIFTLVGSSAVRVSTADRLPIAMFFTSPAARLDAGDSYEITLQRPAPRAQGRITQWFLPNQAVGLQFLYSAEEVRGER
jgi:hypothetical protein